MNRDISSEILARLMAAYPDARCELSHENPFQLAVATILSAQCTDVRVNMVTPALFAVFPDAESMAAGDAETVEELIRSTGFYKNKTKSLLGLARVLIEKYNGQLPKSMAELVKLPGIGRKTANVIRINAFNLPGITVDTHCIRVSNRLGLTDKSDPTRIELDLQQCFEECDWAAWSHCVIFHGRYCCRARNPSCERCVVSDLCAYYASNTQS